MLVLEDWPLIIEIITEVPIHWILPEPYSAAADFKMPHAAAAPTPLQQENGVS